MSTTALFYGSSTGNTQEVATNIAQKLGIKAYNIASSSIDEIKNYDKLVIGLSTWGEGDLQDDWEDIWEDFCEIDFTGKCVALFGLGDQESYSDEYCDAMGTLYKQVVSKGANVIGFTSTDGYTYDDSTAIIDDEFVGLALDLDNQDDLTDERVLKWIEQIKGDIL